MEEKIFESGNGLPPKGVESEQFEASVRKSLDALARVHQSIVSITSSEPTQIEVSEKSMAECCAEAADAMEKMFAYTALEFDPSEEERVGGGAAGDDDDYVEEEDEEGNGEDGDGDDEMNEDGGAGDGEEDDEDDDDYTYTPANKERNVLLGETSHYCPVSLRDKEMLVPGNPEIQSKYKDKLYRFHSDEARHAFNEDPDAFLPSPRNPQLTVSVFVFSHLHFYF